MDETVVTTQATAGPRKGRKRIADYSQAELEAYEARKQAKKAQKSTA
jgi:hypothetical protein